MNKEKKSQHSQELDDAQILVHQFSDFKVRNYFFSVTGNKLENWIILNMWVLATIPYLLLQFSSWISQLVEPELSWPFDLFNMTWTLSKVLTPFSLVMILESLLLRRFVLNAPKSFSALADLGRLKHMDITK